MCYTPDMSYATHNKEMGAEFTHLSLQKSPRNIYLLSTSLTSSTMYLRGRGARGNSRGRGRGRPAPYSTIIHPLNSFASSAASSSPNNWDDSFYTHPADAWLPYDELNQIETVQSSVSVSATSMLCYGIENINYILTPSHTRPCRRNAVYWRSIHTF